MSVCGVIDDAPVCVHINIQDASYTVRKQVREKFHSHLADSRKTP